jgi:hypothetical protein
MDSTYNLCGGFKPTIKRVADRDGPDFYPTPAWATRALIDNERFHGEVWECACGDGAMSAVLADAANRVESSDLYDRGYGEIGHDFLTTRRRHANIITNPPFHSAEGFVASALQAAERKFALLLRLAFLEGANRTNTIFHRAPPARVWVFSERITFCWQWHDGLRLVRVGQDVRWRDSAMLVQASGVEGGPDCRSHPTAALSRVPSRKPPRAVRQPALARPQNARRAPHQATTRAM